MNISPQLALSQARERLQHMRNAADGRTLAYRFGVAQGYINALRDFAGLDAETWRHLLDEAEAVRHETDAALHPLVPQAFILAQAGPATEGQPALS
ncbi:hypothetical protein thsps21_43690 [Pseudomonas sp. No.21]|uniref:hypothetical protein n=1 Tax=Pseudomonas TaxID=286 RepID=UPI0013144172|nr:MULTISPECIES: hypothetical protein [Pseudomonas]MDW3712236.1 hypothetical protein [Pseudomonas sp. 2023EL-01195]GJN46079.1 hypothetical protein TUM20249_20650 [Pseudomonas tohonis]